MDRDTGHDTDTHGASFLLKQAVLVTKGQGRVLLLVMIGLREKGERSAMVGVMER